MKPTDRQPTVPDGVIAEVHRHKEAIAAEHGYDIDALLESLRKREKDNQRLDSRVPAAKASESG